MFDDTISAHDVKAESAPDPAPEERAWNDGYTAGVTGEKDGPVGLAGTVRAAWWAGFTAGFAHASERRAAVYRAAEFLHPEVVDWMAATWDVTSDPS